MVDSDPWEILGVAPGSSKVEIRRAYRRLARRYHPDLNPGNPDAEARFKEVQAAYEALTEARGRHKPQQGRFSEDGEAGQSAFASNEHPFFGFWDAYLRMRQSSDKQV